MASLGKNKGPYSVDYKEVKHRGVTTTTILNSKFFDDLISNIENEYDYEVAYVPAGYEHRPDLISNVYYGTVANWWLLMLVNGISDPLEGFAVGQQIVIPKII